MVMILRWCVLVVLLLGVGVWAEDAAGVENLTTEQFRKTIKDTKHVLVSFTAPWCGHCKALKPEMAKAAEQLKDLPEVVLANVDCTVEKDLCKEFEVQGYPTMKWFANSKPTEYDGGREKKDIIDYVVKYTGPALTLIDSAEKLKEFSKSSPLVAVAFVDKSDTANKAVVEKIAEEIRSTVRFAHYEGVPEGVEDCKGMKAPGLLLYRSFEEGAPAKLEGEFTAEQIASFMKQETFAVLDEISPTNYRLYLARELPLVWVFLPESGTEEILKFVKESATKFKGKISVVHLSGSEYKRHAENMGLTGEKFPAVVVDDFTAKKKFLVDENAELTEKALTEFLDKFTKGEVEPHVKSEEIPAKNDEPVTVVVGKNYDSVVLDSKKDVLLELYAPWCGHCKQLEPKYKKVGEHFKDTPSIVIAKVDATANDVPLDIEGFPTIKFFPAGAAEPIEYEGARSTNSLIKYVLEHSTTLSDEQKKTLDVEEDKEEAEEDVPEGEEEPLDGEEEEKDEL